MSELNDREETLFDEWERNLRSEGKGFVRDGVVCARSYESSSPRIVFVLEEANDPGGTWDLRGFLRDGAQGQTWNNVTRWTRGILTLPRIVPWEALEVIDKRARAETLRKIVAVNIKKTPGGGNDQECNILFCHIFSCFDRTLHNILPHWRAVVIR